MEDYLVFAFPQSGADSVHRVENQQFAIFDDTHPVTDGFNMKKVVRAEQNRLPFALEGFKVIDDEERSQRIQT